MPRPKSRGITSVTGAKGRGRSGGQRNSAGKSSFGKWEGTTRGEKIRAREEMQWRKGRKLSGSREHCQHTGDICSSLSELPF